MLRLVKCCHPLLERSVELRSWCYHCSLTLSIVVLESGDGRWRCGGGRCGGGLQDESAFGWVSNLRLLFGRLVGIWTKLHGLFNKIRNKVSSPSKIPRTTAPTCTDTYGTDTQQHQHRDATALTANKEHKGCLSRVNRIIPFVLQ